MRDTDRESLSASGECEHGIGLVCPQCNSGPIPRDHLWVNADRTVLVRQWASGSVEVALRESPDHIWGPPILCAKEGS